MHGQPCKGYLLLEGALERNVKDCTCLAKGSNSWSL